MVLETAAVVLTSLGVVLRYSQAAWQRWCLLNQRAGQMSLQAKPAFLPTSPISAEGSVDCPFRAQASPKPWMEF